ncbi:MAG: hypothetical protein AAF657_41685 [Acidobacteriota bacterium]
MASVQVRSQVSLEELLNGVAQLEALELEQFVSKVLALRAQRLAPSLGHEEARLLEAINRTLPSAEQLRFDELSARRQAETLTQLEHQELLAMIDRIEQSDVERLGALVELAQLRGTTLEALKIDLGIQTPPIL